ncbi:MAG: hypothetical protein JJW01_02615 [Alphaproteobacteria bacterium]|nr:hypothetical protein [Rickettsiales bacterium]
MEKQTIGLTFNFILGAENIKQNPMLSSIQGGQLFKMHKFVAPSLAFQTSEGYLEDRWAKRGPAVSGEYFVAYLSKDGEVKSIVSGIKKEKDLHIMNTATLPELRQKGYLKAVLYNLVLSLSKNYPKVENIHGLLSSGVPTGKHPEITLEALQEINERSNKIRFIQDKKAKNYGETIGKTVQALKENKEGQKIHEDIIDNPGYNFKIAEKALAETSKVTEAYAGMTKGTNFNFTPYIKSNSNLTEHSLKEVEQFDKKRRLSFEEKLQQKKSDKSGDRSEGRGQVS